MRYRKEILYIQYKNSKCDGTHVIITVISIWLIDFFFSFFFQEMTNGAVNWAPLQCCHYNETWISKNLVWYWKAREGEKQEHILVDVVEMILVHILFFWDTGCPKTEYTNIFPLKNCHEFFGFYFYSIALLPSTGSQS